MRNRSAQTAHGNWKTWLIYAGTALAILLVGLWGFDLVGAHQLRAACRQAYAIGGPFTLQEMLATRRVWPDEKNGAQVILALQPRLEELNKRADDWKRLPLFTTESPPFGRQWSPEVAATVREFLEANQDLLATIDELGAFEGGQMPFAVTENPLDIQWPALSELRTSVRFKSLQVLEAAMRGETGRLSEDVRIMLLHGDLLTDEPTLISQMVRGAVTRSAVYTVEEVCALAPVDAAQLQAIEQMLAPFGDVRGRIEWSLRSERAFWLAATDYLRMHGDSNGNLGLPISAAAGVPGGQGLLMQEQARGLGFFNRLLIAADQGCVLEEARAIESEVLALGPQAFLTRMLMPSLTKPIAWEMELAAETQCARVALAAERYRLVTGRFPAELGELVPQYIDRVPSDPFDPPEPIEMNLNTERLAIYSVGQDGIDSDGDLRRDNTRSRGTDCGFLLMTPAYRNLPGPLDTAPVSASDSSSQ
jgi:hypothetical protein